MKYIFTILLVCLFSAFAVAASAPIDHVSFTTINVTGTDPFREIALVNTGAADMFIRFYWDRAGTDLAADSLRVPAGTSMYDEDIGRTAYGYWLSSAGTSTTGWYD